MANKFAARHYEAIAATLKAERPAPHWCANKRCQWDQVVKAMATLFEQDHPSTNTNGNYYFKRDRFIDACGGLFNV